MFTTIAFGMCAYLVPFVSGAHPTMIIIGNITNDHICDPVMFFPDTHGQRAQINGHEYGVSVVDDGATLYFDNKMFFFMKDSI